MRLRVVSVASSALSRRTTCANARRGRSHVAAVRFVRRSISACNRRRHRYSNGPERRPTVGTPRVRSASRRRSLKAATSRTNRIRNDAVFTFKPSTVTRRTARLFHVTACYGGKCMYACIIVFRRLIRARSYGFGSIGGEAPCTRTNQIAHSAFTANGATDDIVSTHSSGRAPPDRFEFRVRARGFRSCFVSSTRLRRRSHRRCSAPSYRFHNRRNRAPGEPSTTKLV